MIVRLISLTALLTLSASAATFSVSNSDDSGPGSLRAAITDANNNPGLDEIIVTSAGLGNAVPPNNILPPITSPVNLIADYHLGPNPTNRGFSIIPGGIAAPDRRQSRSLLRFAAGSNGSTIRGLRIGAAKQFGIGLRIEAANVSVYNCHLGVGGSGLVDASPSDVGTPLFVADADSFRLGRPGESNRNVIGGTVNIRSNNAIIENNHFGVSADGTQSLFPSGQSFGQLNFLYIHSPFCRIGGPTLDQRNYFAGSTSGIIISPGVYQTTIQNNLFGFLKNGTPSEITGTAIDYSDLYLPVDIGRLAITIDGNYLNCRTGPAIKFLSQSAISTPIAEITNNQIGISPLGIETFPGKGIFLTSSAPLICRDNILRNCASAGIIVASSVPFVTSLPAFRSVTSYDTYADVSQNSITGTLAGSAILLAPTPSTTINPANDNLDSDSGSNGLLNSPLLTSVSRPTTSATLVQGSFNSLPNRNFTIYYYSDRSNVPNPGPRDLLGSQTVVTDASGNATLSATLPATSSGQWINAIATTTIAPFGTHSSPVSPSIQVASSGRFTLSNTIFSATEGQSIPFQINRINGTAGAASVRITNTSLSPTATPGSDYSITGTDFPDGTVNFAPGQTSRTLTFNALQDDIDEPATETIILTLANPSNGTSADNTPKLANVLDDDASPTISLTSATVTEGNDGATPVAVFTAVLSRPCERIANRNISSLAGSGPNPTDVADIGTPTILPVSTSVYQIQVPIRGDNALEPDESFALATSIDLTTPTVGVFETVTSPLATGIILNDDSAPAQFFTFTSSDILVDEDVGTITATVQRNLATGTATVKVLAIDINSTHGSDYLGAQTSSLTFAPGELTKSVTYSIVDDAIHEDSESFALTLVEPTGAGIGAVNSFTVLIKNNDPFPNLTISDISQPEGDDTQTIFITLNLSIESRRPASITCTTRAGTATADQDFKSNDQLINFPPGTTTAQFPITIFGDTTFETDESFFVDLSYSFGLQPVTFTAEITLTNDDFDHPVIAFTSTPVTILENVGTIPITIHRIGKTDIPAVFKIDQSGASTAGVGTDFTLPDSTYTIPANQTELTTILTIVDDAIAEPSESIVLNLVPVDATSMPGTPASLSIEIIDDDIALAPQFLVSQPESTPLISGDSRDFGTVISGTTADLLFTLANPGNSPLTGCSATLSGSDSAAFSLVGTIPTTLQPISSTIPFLVRFTATTTGLKNATLTLTTALGSFPIPLTATTLVLSSNTDTDNDGLSDLAEYQLRDLGFDYTLSQPDLVASLFSGSNSAGLFTQSQLGALNVPSPLLARNPTTGEFTLTIGVEKSTTLTSFTPFPFTAPQTLINTEGKLEFRFTSPDNKAFFILKSNP